MTRDPRRAYDKDGREIKPATVARQAALGLHRVEIFCNDCNNYRGGIDASGLPPETAIPDVCLRYICSRCGSKNLICRGDMHEFYEQDGRHRQDRSD